MLETRYRSGVATRIVGLDRQRFNEVVADGDYTCAPATTMRSVRLFTRDDLLPLWVFAGLLALGFSSRSAGELACDLKHAMGVGGGIDRWVYVRSRYDGSVMAEADYDRLHERGLDHPVHWSDPVCHIVGPSRP